MKDTSKLLPVGTVLLLEGGEKKVMITGFYTIPENNQNTVYDYSGCLYPEGIISSNQTLLFNHNQITKVFYMGYKDKEEQEFKKKLGEVINKTNPSQNNNPIDLNQAA